MESYLTTEQVANILQVHPFTILKFIKSGKLRGIKLGRVYRIKESDVQSFLEGRSTKPDKRQTSIEEPKPYIETHTINQPKTSDVAPYPISPSAEGGEAPHYYII